MTPNAFSKEDSLKVKGIAIILMMIHHCFLSPERYQGQNVIFAPFSENAWNEWALYFKICVAIFVFISAYGLTVTFKSMNAGFNISKEKLANVVVRRYIKLMSSYLFIFVALQIYSLLMGKGRYTYVYGNKPTSVVYLLLDLFGLAHILGTPTFLATFWYMGFAQIIIFIVPLLIAVYRVGGCIVLTAAAVLMAFVPQYRYEYFPRYVICIAFGIICADKDGFAFLKSLPGSLVSMSVYISKSFRFLTYMLLLYEMERLREGELKSVLLPVFDAVIPVVIIGFAIEFINPLPFVGSVLKVLGKYSMNIFLIHNFIRVIWYYDFTYSFRYAGLIVLVLLVTSLFAAMCLEWIKKLVHFDQGVDWVMRHALAVGTRIEKINFENEIQGVDKRMTEIKLGTDRQTDRQTFIKSFLGMLVVYGVGISAILRADFNYIDDMGRIAEGYRGWNNFARYISYYLALFIHADEYLTDVSPLPQLIAVILLALSGVIVLYVISEKRNFSIGKLIALVPLGLSPYFLACISFKYDAPYMALSILVSVCPVLFCDSNLFVYTFVAAMGTLAMCMTYQASSGIYPMLVLLLCMRKWNKGETLKKSAHILIISFFGYMSGLVLFKVFFLNRINGYRSTSMPPVSQLLPTYISNISKYFETVKSDFKREWLWLIVLMGLTFVVITVISSHRKKAVSLIAAVLTLLIMSALTFGVYPFLQEPFLNPRGMYGIGVFLSYIGVAIMDMPKAYPAKIINLLLCWAFFVFSFTYGNALNVQKNYTDFRIHMIMSDINELEVFTDDQKTKIQIYGTIGRSPIIKNMPQDYQILNRLVPVTLSGGSMWGQCGFYNYYGIKNVSSNWRTVSSDIDRELPILKDTMYHTIKGNADYLLIELK